MFDFDIFDKDCFLHTLLKIRIFGGKFAVCWIRIRKSISFLRIQDPGQIVIRIRQIWIQQIYSYPEDQDQGKFILIQRIRIQESYSYPTDPDLRMLINNQN